MTALLPIFRKYIIQHKVDVSSNSEIKKELLCCRTKQSNHSINKVNKHIIYYC